MRSGFDRQLEKLNSEMIEMGALCEQAIAMAAKALTEGSEALEKEIIALDSDIDQKEHDIETLCLRMLLQQQPVARDLRQISAALKMITDLERIGDQASDIAEILEVMDGRTAADCELISEMARAAIRMVTGSIDAYVKQDTELAENVAKNDDIVDDYFDRVRKRLIKMIAENPNDGEYAIDLLMIAKYFERIGDHATNIAEWVVFSVTGVHKGGVEL